MPGTDRGARRGAGRRGRRRRLALVLPLALVLAGLCGASAQAAGHHHSAAKDSAVFTCTGVTYTFENFPNAPHNTVKEVVHVDGKIAGKATYTFDGPTGSNTVPVTVPPGHHSIDAYAVWKTNGAKGGQDIHKGNGITCRAEPRFSIQKLQKLSKGSAGYSTATLTSGHVGESVEYEIVVTNTGNVPLTFTEFVDSHCDGGTISGGPGASPVESGSSTTYFCDHVLTNADRSAGSYDNDATVTGKSSEGSPTTHTSNTVVVEVPDPNNTAKFSCKSVTYVFTGFPNLPNNTVTEVIHVDGQLVYKGVFVFNGSSASNTITLNLSPGHHSVDARSIWKTNGYKGGRDIHKFNGVTCPEPESGFTIEKSQEIEGSGEGFTSSPLTGHVGQTVDYQIVVKNTGTTTLTFSEFSDPNCEGISGGPTGPLAPNESATYTCDHVLSEAGAYTNTATDTGAPPEAQGEPITETSNAVVVEVPPEPAFTIEKLQKLDPVKGGEFTTSELEAEPGQTVDYEVIVTNTGNVSLTFGELSDASCEEISGGPPGPLAPGESATYTCDQVLGEPGRYSNSASATGTPPAGDGEPITETSNTVVTDVPAKPSFTIEKLQEIEGSGGGFTKLKLTAEAGQTMDYEIIVKNTGNVPLKMSKLTDAGCEEISPNAERTLEVTEGESFDCHHTLTTVGTYTNEASIEGNEGTGTETSNKVEVEVEP